jgi:hypothetical protein
MHPSLQHAHLAVLEAFLASSADTAARPQASSAQLAALLQLLQGQQAPIGPTGVTHKTGPAIIAKMSYRAAQSHLEQAIGFSNLAEVHLWLDCLPKASTEDGNFRCVTCPGMIRCWSAAGPLHRDRHCQVPGVARLTL